MREEDLKKLEQQLRALRDPGDPALHDRITRQYPADWDMEAVFQESLKRAEQKQQKPSVRRRLYCCAGIAACFALTMVLTHSAWARQQKVEVKLPECVTTVQTTAEIPQTTAEIPQTTTEIPETTTEIPETTAQSPVPKASETTPLTETVVTETTAVVTTATEPVYDTGTVEVIAEAAEDYIETEPAVTDAPERIGEPQDVITETEQTPAEPDTIPEETEPPAEEAAPPSLEGYTVQQFGARAKVTYMGEPPVCEEQEDLQHFHGLYSLRSAEQDMTIMILTPEDLVFCDLPEEGGFAFWCDADAELTEVQVLGDPAVFAVTEEKSTLYWSNGTYTFWVVGDTKNCEEMIETASIFMQLYAQ